MVKRRGIQISKRRGSLACGGGGEGERQGQGLNPGKPVFFFSRLSFRNYLSCVFNCDDLLGRSLISSPHSSTEVIVVLLIKPTAF